MASHQVPTGTVDNLSAARSYSNPFDLIDKHLGFEQEGAAYAALMNTVAWRFDKMIENAGKAVIFARYKDTGTAGTPGAFDTFCQTLAEELRHDSLYEDRDTPEGNLAQLLGFRDEVYRITNAAYAMADQNEISPPEWCDVIIVGKKPEHVDSKEAAGHAQLARLRARGDKDKEARLYATYMAAALVDALSMHERDTQLLPTTLAVVDTVRQYSEAHTSFMNLTYKTRESMVKAIIASCESATERVIKRLKGSPIARGDAVEALFQLDTALNKLQQEQYSEVAELEYAGNSAGLDAHARRQKALAAATE